MSEIPIHYIFMVDFAVVLLRHVQQRQIFLDDTVESRATSGYEIAENEYNKIVADFKTQFFPEDNYEEEIMELGQDTETDQLDDDKYSTSLHNFFGREAQQRRLVSYSKDFSQDLFNLMIDYVPKFHKEQGLKTVYSLLKFSSMILFRSDRRWFNDDFYLHLIAEGIAS